MSAAEVDVLAVMRRVDDDLQRSMHYAISHELRSIMNDVRGLIEERDALKAVLKTVMGMEVRGHELHESLQFSTPGRAILEQAMAAGWTA